MDHNYEMTFAYEKIGKVIMDYLKPYIERFGLKVDINRSTDKNLYLLGRSGEYAGTITYEEDNSYNYILYLDGEGTVILSGEMRDDQIFGAVTQVNPVDRTSLNQFTTFSTKLFNGYSDCEENVYADNIKAATRGMAPRPLNWTWKDINALLITKKGELKPNYTRRFGNMTADQFMKAIMVEYEEPSYISQKAV